MLASSVPVMIEERLLRKASSETGVDMLVGVFAAIL